MYKQNSYLHLIAIYIYCPATHSLKPVFQVEDSNLCPAEGNTQLSFLSANTLVPVVCGKQSMTGGLYKLLKTEYIRKLFSIVLCQNAKQLMWSLNYKEGIKQTKDLFYQDHIMFC